MIQKDDLEKKLFNYFNENKSVPKEVTKTIFEVNLNKNKRKIGNMSIWKMITTIISVITMSTGIVFAKDIYKFTQKLFFDSKKGVESAIENGYIYDEGNQQKESEIIKSENTDTRVSRMIMDDFSLDIEMVLELDCDIDLNRVKNINFPDMIITDNMDNILYCVNNEKIKNFCNKKGLSNNYDSIKEFYINTTSNVFLKSVSNKNAIIECNLTAINNKFPRSEKLYIQLNTIEIENDSQKYIIEGDWEIKFIVPEVFVNRKSTIYKAVNCNSDNVDIKSIAVEVYETGTKFDMSMYWGNYEEWSKKTDEIRNQNVLESQLINFEKSYIENERGEKFYSSKSSYAGNGLTRDGRLRLWNTFDLTKYDMTDKLKVVLITIENEKILIELQK